MPLQPSFRRKPESSVVISCYDNGAGKHRFRLPQPSFRLLPSRHSDSLPAVIPTPPAVIPTPPAVIPTPPAVIPTPRAIIPTPPAVIPTPSAVIPTPSAVIPTPSAVIPTPQAVIPTPPAVIPTPSTVIPAQAGIYACRLHYSSRRLRRWIPAQTRVRKVRLDPHRASECRKP